MRESLRNALTAFGGLSLLAGVWVVLWAMCVLMFAI